jgi:hypothetical protein
MMTLISVRSSAGCAIWSTVQKGSRYPVLQRLLMMALVDQDSKILAGDLSTELKRHVIGYKQVE